MTDERQTPPHGTRVRLDPDELESIADIADTFAAVAGFLRSIAERGGGVDDAATAALRCRRLGDRLHEFARELEEK